MKKLIISLSVIFACITVALVLVFLYGPMSQRHLHYDSLPELVKIEDVQVYQDGAFPVLKVTFHNSSDWVISLVTATKGEGSDVRGDVPTLFIGERAIPVPAFISDASIYAGIRTGYACPLFKNRGEDLAALAAEEAVRLEIPVKTWNAQRRLFGGRTYSADGALDVMLRYPEHKEMP